MHKVLVNCLFKLAQEKSVVRRTDRPAMTNAVDLGRKATKQTKTKKREQTSFWMLNFLSNILSLVLVQPMKICLVPHSAVGNVSGYRCVSDCRSRGREFDPGPVSYFRG